MRTVPEPLDVADGVETLRYIDGQSGGQGWTRSNLEPSNAPGWPRLTRTTTVDATARSATYRQRTALLAAPTDEDRLSHEVNHFSGSGNSVSSTTPLTRNAETAYRFCGEYAVSDGTGLCVVLPER